MFAKGKSKNFKEVAGFAAGGGVLGAGLSSFIGNMGLAGGFGAISIGATPLVGAGIVVGVAAYGIKKLFE